MFSNVRVNQQIFVLDKANGVFEVGTVCEEPKFRYSQQPMSQNGQFNNPYQMPQTVQVVDLKIQTPNGLRTLSGLPVDKNVFDNEAKTLFCTEDKNLMLNEFKVLKTQSENHVKQTQYHQDMIGRYGGWIEMLDPVEAEKKRNEQEIATLKKSVAEQTELTRQALEQNRELIQQIQMFMNKSDGGNAKPSKTKENA